MSRRKIDPTLLLRQSHDSTFPTELQNRNVTRFGNPATSLGACYVVSDLDGLGQTAIDLEFLRLILDKVPITASMVRKIEDRVKREQILLDNNLSAQGVPENLKSLLDLDRIADVRKYFNKQEVSEYELFLFIRNCKQIGWRHHSKFPEYVPDHLEITEKDRRDSNRGELKIVKKIGPIMDLGVCEKF
jgi:hypothetical protein